MGAPGGTARWIAEQAQARRRARIQRTKSAAAYALHACMWSIAGAATLAVALSR